MRAARISAIRCRLIALWAMCWLAWPVAADSADAKIKAGYLFNFTRLVEWPTPGDEPLHVCVVGADAVVEQLGELASRDSKGRALQIWSGTEELQICQLLYIDGDSAMLPGLLQQTKSRAVLTVSDQHGFAARGGGIGFYREQDQIKVEINPQTVSGAQLKVNALLMEIARIVVPSKP
ncbi:MULTISPECIES: YfiR family protein [Methylomonas]|uniref:Transmembrane protein n=1 Tax=Methylomonas koyamae TaxID=702114 RepID=A0A177NS14_9GAMM|nr:YfiR family protein [Methylomonas koyamae]NJA06381.1 YfiR family protein [Methylococcaceae bacterium WWC4]OAI20019.1 hypothetical protein A1355_03485 [Methylomonas koyamae]